MRGLGEGARAHASPASLVVNIHASGHSFSTQSACHMPGRKHHRRWRQDAGRRGQARSLPLCSLHPSWGRQNKCRNLQAVRCATQKKQHKVSEARSGGVERRRGAEAWSRSEVRQPPRGRNTQEDLAGRRPGGAQSPRTCRIPPSPSFLTLSLDGARLGRDARPFQSRVKQSTTGEGPWREESVHPALSCLPLGQDVPHRESYCLFISELCDLALFFPYLV